MLKSLSLKTIKYGFKNKIPEENMQIFVKTYELNCIQFIVCFLSLAWCWNLNSLYKKLLSHILSYHTITITYYIKGPRHDLKFL